MIFEDVRSGGGCSYVVACGETCAGAVIDPELPQIDRTLALIGKSGSISLAVGDRVSTGWCEAGYAIESTAPQG